MSEFGKIDQEEINSSKSLSLKLPEMTDISKIVEKDKRWIGKTLLFGYYKHNPLFTIGPHCKGKR